MDPNALTKTTRPYSFDMAQQHREALSQAIQAPNVILDSTSLYAFTRTRAALADEIERLQETFQDEFKRAAVKGDDGEPEKESVVISMPTGEVLTDKNGTPYESVEGLRSEYHEDGDGEDWEEVKESIQPGTRLVFESEEARKSVERKIDTMRRDEYPVDVVEIKSTSFPEIKGVDDRDHAPSGAQLVAILDVLGTYYTDDVGGGLYGE